MIKSSKDNAASTNKNLDESTINEIYSLIDELIDLHGKNKSSLDNDSTFDAISGAGKALTAFGMLGKILTEWAEETVFNIYHKNNIDDNGMPNKDPLAIHRRAISDIIFTHFIARDSEWHKYLSEGLIALNEGEVEDLFQPSKSRAQGQPNTLKLLKIAAVKHVYKLCGSGWKKIAAQTKVSEECGVTYDSIKKWEKELLKKYPEVKEECVGIEWVADLLETTRSEHPNFSEEAIISIIHDELKLLDIGEFFDVVNGYAEELTSTSNEDWFNIFNVALHELERSYPLGELGNKMKKAGLRL